MCIPYGSFSNLVALSYSNLFLIYLSVFYLIIIPYMLLYCLMRARKGVDVDEMGGGQELGGVRDKENHNPDIL